MEFRKVSDYHPPKFAYNLAFVPSKRVKLATLPTPLHKWNLPGVPDGFQLYIKRDDLAGFFLSGNKLATLPTPLHKWNLPGVPDDFQLYIKRDDLTGNFLSGNKIRKLEFLLADALDKGCGSVIACGTYRSNCCRATSVATAQLGLDCHLLLRSKNKTLSVKDTKQLTTDPGNLLPSIFCGSQLYFVPFDSDFELDFREREEKLAKRIEHSTGKPAYCIPKGATDSTGVFGYIEAWNELMNQEGFDKIDDIFVATSTGGTLIGLCIGNYLTGQKIKLHGMSGVFDKDYYHEHANVILRELNVTEKRSEDLVDIIDDHRKSMLDDHYFLQEVASSTGIFCDPVYSGKALKGMLAEMKTNPSRFQGKNVMFVATGGTLGLYGGGLQTCLDNTFTKLAHTWEDKMGDPQPIN